MRSVFCRACGVHEVAQEGDVCERCQSYLDSFSSNGSQQQSVIFQKPGKVSTVVETGLECKWPECHESVASHKGSSAGFCTRLQENGKTHRQMHLEEMRESDPNYGRKGSVLSTQQFRPPPDSSGISWLTEVKERIDEALSAVSVAEAELEYSKQRLREILAEAQEAVR